MKKLIRLLSVIPVMTIFACMAIASSSGTTNESFKSSETLTTNSASADKSSNTETAVNNETDSKTEIETEIETEPEPSDPETYENNKYYDIVETAVYKSSLNYTTVVHKVLAKKDTTVESTVLAYDGEGNVIGKSSDSIVLTNGQYNYFKYSFDSDVSNAQLQAQVTSKSDSFLTTGERNAVEMVQYNKSGDDLYITFKQTGDYVGSFSKFKILFYKDNKIVDTDEGYFSIYAENLNGKDSTDVAEIWVLGQDFDSIECYYEP